MPNKHMKDAQYYFREIQFKPTEICHFTATRVAAMKKIVASGPITSWEIDREIVETVSDFIFGGSKITAAMKLKDAYSLEGKL